MSNTTHQIEEVNSPVKLALDHAELIERVPALQPAAVEYETSICEFTGKATPRMNENGAFVLIFPRHKLVATYAANLASINTRRAQRHNMDVLTRRSDVTLKDMRRKLRAATTDYENRVNWRGVNVEWKDGGKFVSLSAIIEARAEALYWRKMVKEQEAIERVKQQNRWAVAHSHVTPI